ncbi:hypothetical protein N9B76_00360 [Candidatus Thioglobus sp.]|nr:hypothetical protein [Candidatus Thioglobus sp.]
MISIIPPKIINKKINKTNLFGFLTLKAMLAKNKQLNDESYQFLEILEVLEEGRETKKQLPVIGK